MKKSLTLLLLTFLIGPSYAQPDCAPGQFQQRIHGNNVSANLSLTGTLFTEDGEGSFNVPFDPVSTVSTIFTTGLCVLGKDAGGNLVGGGTFYGGLSGNSDFWPGPLTDTGQTITENCENWDQLWKVEKYQVYNHLVDFNDNGVIDDPIDDIYKWPGAGNPNFESMNGFALPDLPQGYAPFWDENSDGIYDPSVGDYPIAPNTNQEAFPEQLFWGVFNDAGNVHTEFNGVEIGMEIQFSAWAYACESENDLNNSVFVSYKFINRSVEVLEDGRVGLFVDFDLGCFEDDYIGSIPDKNTFYVYNADDVDGTASDSTSSFCTASIPTYQNRTPTQSVTILDGELDYFGVISSVGIGGPPGQGTPVILFELYNYMNGLWRDGLPFSEGGNGYDPLQTNPVTNHLYDGNPNDPEEWSMIGEDLLIGDYRAMASTIIPDLNPGQATELTYVFTYFDDEGNDNIQNVQSIYDRVDFIQFGYDQGMVNACDYQQVCIEDCVWPGDTNEDGIANHFDLLPIMTNVGESGPERLNYPTWAPKFAENWTQDGVKHADANGDGMIDIVDLYTTDFHYDFTNSSYVVPEANYPIGNNVYVELTNGADIDNLDFGQFSAISVKLRNVENLHALAYTLEYDPAYYSMWNPTSNLFGLSIGAETASLARWIPDQGEIAYASGKIEDLYNFEDEVINTIVIRINPDLANEVLESNQTRIRFRNLIGLDADGNDLNIGAEDVVLTIPGIMVSNEEIVLEGLSVFPNPTSGMVSVESPQTEIISIKVFDVLGKLVESFKVENTVANLNLQSVKSGVYFLELETEKGTQTRKLMIR